MSGSKTPDRAAAEKAVGVSGDVLLSDGRKLAYADWGDRAGTPVLEFRGLPGSCRGSALDLTTMILSCRAPTRARCIVGTVVTAERLRPGTVHRGLLKALPEVDRRVAAQESVRDSLADSYTFAFRQGVRGRVRDRVIIASPWGFRPEETNVPVQLYHGGLDEGVPLGHTRDLAARIPRCHQGLGSLGGQDGLGSHE